MSLWTASALRDATGGTFTRAFDADGISIDTRTLRPGDLFVALLGTADGHAHIAAALAAGAAGVLAHRRDAVPEGAPALIVDDTLAGLAALGHAARARFEGQVVAVTGSVGKTTTKEMLRTALAAYGTVHAAPASYNNHWGVPLTLARIPPGTQRCVVEIGMNTEGEIAPLARMARPHVAVVTTIAPAHIGRLGSIEAIAREKAAIFTGLEPGGVAVVPADAPCLDLLLRAAPGPVLRFGGQGDVHATRVGRGAEGSDVQALVAGVPLGFRLHAPGAHLVANALAALAAVAALGLDPAPAAAALEGFAPGAGRGQQRRIAGGEVLLLDESYNASALSVRAALDVLSVLPGRRRLAVLGDMLELGDIAEAEHAGLAPDVAKAADMLYACGPLTRSLFDRVPPRLRAAHAEDAEALAPIVAAALRPGDAVLVKGSLGSRMRVVVRALEAVPATHEGTG